jgi:hypothetical protein
VTVFMQILSMKTCWGAYRGKIKISSAPRQVTKDVLHFTRVYILHPEWNICNFKKNVGFLSVFITCDLYLYSFRSYRFECYNLNCLKETLFYQIFVE